MHRFNAFSHSACAPHTFLKNSNHKKFCQTWYVTDLLYIENLSQFHTLLQPKAVFQELNHELEIPKFYI